jgi:hypothetical protein
MFTVLSCLEHGNLNFMQYVHKFCYHQVQIQSKFNDAKNAAFEIHIWMS